MKSCFFSIVFIFYWLKSGYLFVNCQICNPLKCFILLNKVFQFEAEKDSCMKISEIENCISACYSEVNIIDSKNFKGLQEVRSEVCNNEEGNSKGHNMANKCVDKHKYLLLFCLQESFNLNSVSPKADQNLLMCRRIVEAQSCDQGTLVPCSNHANYITEVLLKGLFKLILDEYCSFEDKEIYGLNITYPVLSNEYKNLALCFDAHSHLFNTCVPEKVLTSSSVTYSYFSYKLCKNVEMFLDCVSKIVQERCYKQKTIYDNISQSMFQYVLPKCFPFNKSLRPTKTISLKDKSDVVMANQQITSRGSSFKILIDACIIQYIHLVVYSVIQVLFYQVL